MAMRFASQPARWFALLAILMGACWWQVRQLGDLRQDLAAFFGYFSVAFVVYLAALWLVRRLSALPGSARASVVPVTVILLGALASRLVLLGTPPTLSADLYRYQWDGRVQQAGIDPYAYPPDTPALQPLHDAHFERINSPHLRTVYPPVAQLAFHAGTWFGGSLAAHKTVFVLAECLIIASLLTILVRRGMSPLWIVAYAWHPLVVLEVAGSGHSDVTGIAFLWLGLAAWQGGRRLTGTLAWAAALLSKFMSILLVAWWIFRRGGRRWLPVFLLLGALPFVLRPTIGTALLESLFAMTGRVESNASFYLAAWALVGDPAVARWLVIAAWGIFLLWWGHRQADPVRYLFGALGVMILLSPVLHPWYVVWLVPFLCFWRVPAAIALTGTVILAYTVWPGYLTEGIWRVPVWARVAEYTPVVALGLWEVKRCVSRLSFLPGTKPQAFAKS